MIETIVETTVETIEKTENKPYKLRELKADDLFVTMKIINKIGVKEFKQCFQSNEVMQLVKASNKDDDNSNKNRKSQLIEKVGVSIVIDIAEIIISNLPAAKDDIYTFLSNLSGIDKKEIANLAMVTFTEMIVDVFKKEEFKDFIKVVSGLVR